MDQAWQQVWLFGKGKKEHLETENAEYVLDRSSDFQNSTAELFETTDEIATSEVAQKL